MNASPDTNPPPHNYDDSLRRLVILWGACCISPIIYLGAAALVKSMFMPENGWLQLEPFTWSRIMIGLIVWLILLQALHLAVKFSARRRFALLEPRSPAFLRFLTRRTIILIALSETAVATGFCLFLLQGEYRPIFISGIAAMLLYAQSHPRQALPVTPQ
jgi:hypothetical protein